MATIPDDGAARKGFKQWTLNKIKCKVGHPLTFLIDPKTGNWYPNGINFSPDPSVDAGHTVSKWTGAPASFALEDSDYNRNLNYGENRTREGVFYNKEVVLIGEVPGELRTALMYERTGRLAPGTVPKALRVRGAARDPAGKWYVEPYTTPVLQPSGTPAARSDVLRFERMSGLKKLGRESLGSMSTWLNEIGIEGESRDPEDWSTL